LPAAWRVGDKAGTGARRRGQRPRDRLAARPAAVLIAVYAGESLSTEALNEAHTQIASLIAADFAPRSRYCQMKARVLAHDGFAQVSCSCVRSERLEQRLRKIREVDVVRAPVEPPAVDVGEAVLAGKLPGLRAARPRDDGGSCASAATARPTNNGVSDSRSWCRVCRRHANSPP
jgi:hypothetical protein